MSAGNGMAHPDLFAERGLTNPPPVAGIECPHCKGTGKIPANTLGERVRALRLERGLSTGDLSAAIGFLGDQGNEKVVTLIEGLIGRIAKSGSRAGILTADKNLARRYIDLGCIYTAVGADSGILARGAEALAQHFR